VERLIWWGQPRKRRKATPAPHRWGPHTCASAALLGTPLPVPAALLSRDQQPQGITHKPTPPLKPGRPFVENLGPVRPAYTSSLLQHHDGCAKSLNVEGKAGWAGTRVPDASISIDSLTSLRILKDSVKALFTVPTPFACSSSTSCLKCWQEERQNGSNELQAGCCFGPGEERVTWKSPCRWAPSPSPLLAGQCRTVVDGGGKAAAPLAVPSRCTYGHGRTAFLSLGAVNHWWSTKYHARDKAIRNWTFPYLPLQEKKTNL